MAGKTETVEEMLKHELKTRQTKRETDQFLSASSALAVPAAVVTALLINHGVPAATDELIAAGLVVVGLSVAYMFPAMLVVGLLMWFNRKVTASPK